jgi:hypothetical protein
MELWRESLAHLRYLNDEVWKRFQFFLWVDLVILFAIFAINRHSWFLVFLFSIGGFLLTLVARYILRRNRFYYVQMLLKKTLLEDDLGFYQQNFPGTNTDLAFPWRVAPEKIPLLKEKPEQWIEENIRAKGSIVRRLFVVYEVFLGIFGALLISLACLAFKIFAR